MSAPLSMGLPSEYFVSKRDSWLVAVMWAASLLDFGVALWLLLQVGGAPSIVAPMLLIAGFFQLQVLYATGYRFEGDALRIRASFFRWRVPLAAIDSVEPTNNPLSSPAVSLDRMLIRYGPKRIMISPLDKSGFLRSLATRAPHLEIQGDRAQRR
jgi:hypothetical protein